MSYSYIKSVFPNFETSKMYDQNVYNSLKPSEQKIPANYSLPSAYDEDDINRFAKNLINEKPKIEETQTKLIETYDNVGYSYTPLKTVPRDNLKYYNQPSPVEYLKNVPKEFQLMDKPKIEQNVNIEHFEGQQTKVVQQSDSFSCEGYLKHTLECAKCKGILMKQFNLESDRLRNEELMEVASYMIFGLFILLLIDNLSKK